LRYASGGGIPTPHNSPPGCSRRDPILLRFALAGYYTYAAISDAYGYAYTNANTNATT